MRLYEMKIWDRLNDTYRSLGLYLLSDEAKEALEEKIEDGEFDEVYLDGHIESPVLVEIGEMTLKEAKKYADEHLKVLYIYRFRHSMEHGGDVYWPVVRK